MIWGLDLGGTKLLLVAGAETFRLERGMAFSPEALETWLVERLAGTANPPTALGVSFAGLVSGSTVVMSDVLPLFNGWNTQGLSQRLGLPVFIVNDAEAALYGACAEQNFSMEPTEQTGAVVMVGTGIGMACMVNGEVVRGADGWAGELGWMPMRSAAGIQTLDELASGAALLKRLGVTGETLASRAANGEQVSLEAIQEAATWLGLALCGVMHWLNPRWIVLEGGTMRLAQYFETVKSTVAQYGLPVLVEKCQISRSEAGVSLAARGAIQFSRLNLSS